MMSDVAVREAFHVVLLRQLARSLPLPTFSLKGGVNLRLFFRSRRYSEDMDLDGHPSRGDALRRELRRILAEPTLLRRLAELGIRGIETASRPNKDTETTLRYKIRVVSQGGVPLPTKVEVSFRQHERLSDPVTENADAAIVSQYLRAEELPLTVPHYGLMPALAQKIRALALRAEVQARDVFDISELQKGAGALDIEFLRQRLNDDVLRQAKDRALTLPFEQYRSTVIEFLDPSDRPPLASHGAWDEQRLLVSGLLDSVLQQPGRVRPPPPGEGGTREGVDS